MGKKRERNKEKRLVRQMELDVQQTKKQHDDSLRIRVSRMGSTMDHIYSFVGMSDYNSQLMREGRGHFTFSK